MNQSKILKNISTKFFFWTIAASVTILVLTYFYLTNVLHWSLDDINKLIDSLLKATALIVGTIWFINRYFLERKDMPKFDMVVELDAVKLNATSTMILYRIDLINRANILFQDYEYYLYVEGIEDNNGTIFKSKIARLPESGYDLGLPIEPNSWAAINNEQIIRKNIVALRFYYQIKKNEHVIWSWHKTYKLKLD